MRKTKIEWTDYSWNPVKGLCPNVRLDDTELEKPYHIPKRTSKRIFVGSTIDLFHHISSVQIKEIIQIVKVESYHTFIFLTKNPARYAEFDFPKNCWLGVTVTGESDIEKMFPLFALGADRILFVSIEPFLSELKDVEALLNLDWVIMGALTGLHAKKYPVRREWVERVVNYAKEMHIPLFLKDNLKPVWGDDLIQEFPK